MVLDEVDDDDRKKNDDDDGAAANLFFRKGSKIIRLIGTIENHTGLKKRMILEPFCYFRLYRREERRIRPSNQRGRLVRCIRRSCSIMTAGEWKKKKALKRDPLSKVLLRSFFRGHRLMILGGPFVFIKKKEKEKIKSTYDISAPQ